MAKVLRFIKNAHRLNYDDIIEYIQYIPKYVIKKFIRDNPYKYFELGFIYQYYFKKYKRMHEYYNKSLEDANTLVHLGLYYENNYSYNKDIEYYKKAVELGNADAMFYLGYYYDCININNNDLMKKYYLHAIELGNRKAMFHLGHYYKYTNNYAEMKYYYMLAIKLNCIYGFKDYYFEIEYA